MRPQGWQQPKHEVYFQRISESGRDMSHSSPWLFLKTSLGEEGLINASFPRAFVVCFPGECISEELLERGCVFCVEFGLK